MKAIKAFLFILVFKILLLSIIPQYNISQIDGVDSLSELESLVGTDDDDGRFEAETEENQYVAQSLFFLRTYQGGLLNHLRGIVEPPGTLIRNIFPFADKIPYILLLLFDLIYGLLFVISLFEFIRGMHII